MERESSFFSFFRFKEDMRKIFTSENPTDELIGEHETIREGHTQCTKIFTWWLLAGI